MNKAVTATATTDGKPLVIVALAYWTVTKSAGRTMIAATIKTAYQTSFSTTRDAIRSTSLSFNR